MLLKDKQKLRRNMVVDNFMTIFLFFFPIREICHKDAFHKIDDVEHGDAVIGETFYGLNHFNLAYGGFLKERHYLELAAELSLAPVQEASLLNESLESGVYLLQVGMGYKYYTTPRHTFMGFYWINPRFAPIIINNPTKE
jgi:hypothetical protein